MGSAHRGMGNAHRGVGNAHRGVGNVYELDVNFEPYFWFLGARTPPNGAPGLS